MCGILYYSNSSTGDLSTSYKNFERSLSFLTNRGPDFRQITFNQKTNALIGHTRLAIQGNSVEGIQPIDTPCGRFTILFNGEVYNCCELIKKFNADYKGSSDTVLLAELIGKFELFDVLNAIDGMFALIVICNTTGNLYLSRDIFGEKPLYYHIGKEICISSDIKCIIKLVEKSTVKLNLQAVLHFLQYDYVGDGMTIFDGIEKCQPGELLTIFPNGARVSVSYFNKNEFPQIGGSQISDDWLDMLEELFQSSVAARMIADVDVCLAMSGGIDSSLVAHAMARSQSVMNAYTVAFDDERLDESSRAASYGRFLGIEHNILNVKRDELHGIVYDLPKIFSEPFADSSILPTCLLFNAIPDDKKVVITGDGGDEIFGGYRRHIFANSFLLNNSTGLMRPFYDSLQKLIGGVASNELRKALMVLSQDNNLKAKQLTEKTSIKSFPLEPMLTEDATNFSSHCVSSSILAQLLYDDRTNYLRGNTLVKSDRISAFYSKEARAPFLSRSLLKHAQQINSQHLVGRNGKKGLRMLHDKHFNSLNSFEKKRGFTPPLRSLLRNELLEWTQDSIENVEICGLFEKKEVANLNERFLRNEPGVDPHAYWKMLTLGNWCNEYI
ncbi:asparagine synthase (glutamine-hydrolyzing) [Paracoccaceae bacterium]|nr:asparagine synthase (glutamine-hydrolyzing) [Paracoccaceae bacterium]